VLRLPAFNQRTTPELNGQVSRVSADVTQDQKSGATFYTARITLPDNELARLNGFTLVPACPRSICPNWRTPRDVVSAEAHLRPDRQSLA
jgi:hypothetical protein